jgi:hydrogenase 3 maturation protease
MTALEGWIRERVTGRRVAIVGVGNRLRGDDGVGPRVVDRLRAFGGALLIDAGTVPENHLEPLLEAEPEVVLFVDAVDHDEPVGACCLAAPDALGPRCHTTHAPSLRLLAELLEARGIECVVLGIQPGSSALGAPLTPAAADGVKAAADAILAALAHEAAHV